MLSITRLALRRCGGAYKVQQQQQQQAAHKIIIPAAAATLTPGLLSSPSSLLTTNNSTNTTTTMTMTATVRFYRGDSSEEVAHLSSSEEELLKIAKPKADEIYKDHTKATPDLESRKKRLIYRSKQRGWLEVDLLLGTWASEFVPKLNNKDELDQYEDFVNMETIDIYNIITLRLDVPENMKRPDGNGVVERIANWARSSPLGKADPEKYKSVKTEAKLI